MFCRVYKNLRLCDCIVREEVVVTVCRITIPILPTSSVCLAMKISCGSIVHVALSVLKMMKSQGRVLLYASICVISVCLHQHCIMREATINRSPMTSSFRFVSSASKYCRIVAAFVVVYRS